MFRLLKKNQSENDRFSQTEKAKNTIVVITIK